MPRRSVPLGLLAAAGIALLAVPASAQSQEGVRADRSVLEFLPVDGRVLVPGEVRDDVIEAGDPLLPDEVRVRAWSLDAPAGTVVRIDLESDDVDPILTVVGPGLGVGLQDDDGGDGLNSRICLRIPDRGVRVVAGALYGSVGRYVVSVTEVPEDDPGCGAGLRSISRSVVPSQMELEGELEPGVRTRAVLDGEVRWEDRRSEAWSFIPPASGDWTVAVSSADFDPYLEVLGAGVDVRATDDDGGCGTDAQLTLPLDAGTSYRVIASALFDGEGAYEIRVVSDTAELPTCEGGSPGEGESFDLESVTPVGALRIGDATEGRLDPFSSWIADGHGDLWTLDGEAGASIAITVEADFDPRVVLLGPGIPDSFQDDDGGEELDSRLCVVLPGTGEYQVIVRGFESEPEGPYALGIERDPAPGSCDVRRTPEQLEAAVAAFREEALGAARSIGARDEASGVLDPTTALRDPVDGRAVVPLRLELDAGESRWIGVEAEFDAWLAVIAPDGARRTDDDGGCGRSSRIEYVADAAGTHLILAGALFDPEGPGEWTAWVADGPRGCIDGLAEIPAAGTIEPGGSVESTLRAELPRTDREVQFELWEYVVEGAGPLVVDLRAGFDTWLHVVAPDGVTEFRNDDGPCGLDSRVVIDEPVPGRWRILASALSRVDGTSTPYVLSVASAERDCGSVPAPAGGARTP